MNPDPSPPTRRRLPLKPLLGLGLLLFLLFLAGWLNRHGLSGDRSRAQISALPSVGVVAARRAPVQSELVLPGTLEPLRETGVAARAGGYVKQWRVDIGADVREGDLLAVIDSPDVDQNLAHAEAAQVAAQANLELARLTLERSRELLKRQFIPQQVVDEQQAQFAARQAEVRADQADVTRDRADQAFERVVAPFAGRITVRNVEKGQLVTANNPDPAAALFHLAALDPLRLFVAVPQSQANLIHDGMAVAVHLNEFPGRVFPAQVVRNAGALDQRSKTLLTEIHLPNPHHELASGSYAEAHLPLSQDHPPLIVPSTALVVDQAGSRIAIVGPDNRVHWKAVRTGRDFGTTLEILTGLTVGDRVVANPSDAIQEGVSVQPVVLASGTHQP